MAKFVTFDTVAHGVLPINVDQVCYPRKNVAGQATLVFGAFAGGVHELVVRESFEMVVERLKGPQDLAVVPASPSRTAEVVRTDQRAPKRVAQRA